MRHEVEQKYVLPDPDVVRRRLLEFGVVFSEPVRQVDAYYNHPARDFATTDEALRLRRIGDRNFVTYKGPKLGRAVKTRYELEQPLCDGDEAAAQFRELLERLGFRPTAAVAKLRRSGKLVHQETEFEVCWDEVERLGCFLELELLVDDDAREAAERKLLALQAALGLAAVERRSYLEMILEATDAAD